MALIMRSSVTGKFLKSMAAGRLGGASHLTTSAELAKSQNDIRARMKKEAMVPMGMAAGMITFSTGFGIYTGIKALRTGPNVYVRKSRRETIPEVVEPELVLQESDKYLKKSFFRRFAHIRDRFRREPEPESPDIRPAPVPDIFSRPLKAETLKDIGVDPNSR